MMDRIEIAGEVALYNPASGGRHTVLELQCDCADCVMHTTFGTEPIGETVKIALPKGFHSHEHGALYDTIAQRRDTQWSLFAVGFRDIDAPCRQRLIGPFEKLCANALKVLLEMSDHRSFVYTVDPGRSGAS